MLYKSDHFAHCEASEHRQCTGAAPLATYLLRMVGFSMKEYGIGERDLIIVDRALEEPHGCIVVAILDNEYPVKALTS